VLEKQVSQVLTPLLQVLHKPVLTKVQAMTLELKQVLPA
jgi:hypothetical protein